jgi:hypothetical protein
MTDSPRARYCPESWGGFDSERRVCIDDTCEGGGGGGNSILGGRRLMELCQSSYTCDDPQLFFKEDCEC